MRITGPTSAVHAAPALLASSPMTARPALRSPSWPGSVGRSRLAILAVGVAMIAIGVVQALSRSGGVSAAAVTSWEAGLLDSHLLAAGGTLRSHGATLVALPASLSAHSIHRLDAQVTDGPVVVARAAGRSAANATITSLTITLTPAGRALLLRRTLAHPTTFRLQAWLHGAAGTVTRGVIVTVSR